MLTKRKPIKRIISLVLVLVLALGQSQFPAAAASFSDVPLGAWYEPYVSELTDKGIISGMGNDLYMPQKSLSRAEVVTILTKIALSASDVDQYRGFSLFSDVSKNAWYAPYVNWAGEAGIVDGYGANLFKPDQAITRQELAVMINKFRHCLGYQLQATVAERDFADQPSIAGWSSDSVKVCQRVGIFAGDNYDRFNPQKATARSEAAAVFSNFLVSSYGSSDRIIRKRLAGVYVTGVEFDALNYQAGIGMANDRVNGGEAMSSMIQRTGAKFAVNAGFFDMSSYVPSATIISGGKLITTQETYTPHKTSFVVGFDGMPSIQNFSVNQTVSLVRDGATVSTLSNVAMNRRPNSAGDTTRLLYDAHWGPTVGNFARDLVVFDASHTITTAASMWNDVTIPADGGVLYQRSRREYEGDFFDSCKVGDSLEIKNEYTGLTVGDVDVSIGVGPRIVKNGAVYGNASTYAQEGLGASDIVSGSAKRVAIGVNGSKVIIITVNSCTMAKLSQIMAAAGCTDAMNLDGGGSTGLYYNGEYLATPGRNLNNMIYFK